MNKPQNAQPALQLLQFTDIHIYDDPAGSLKEVNTRQSFDRCIQHARLHHSDAQAILATGDLTHEGSDIAVKRLRKTLDEYGLPVFAIPGNHDRPHLLHEHLAGDRIQVLGDTLLNGWHIILMDSSIAGSESGNLDHEELERLQQSLGEHPDTPTLVCLHHQPAPIGSKWLDTMVIKNGEQVLQLLREHSQVKIVLFGHIHQEYLGSYAHMTLLGSPSTCVQFTQGSEDFALDNKPPAYRWLKLFEDGSFDTGVEWVELK